MIVRRSYKYRLYPTERQRSCMEWTLARCRELYNACLEHRRTAYKRAGVSIGRFDQQRELVGIKEVRPEYRELDAQMLENVVRRVDLAYQWFFSRIKAKQRAGLPRFRGSDRYDSFTFRQNGWGLGENRIALRSIGSVKIRLHRPFEGEIKTITIRRDADQWYACFSCEVNIPGPAVEPAKPAVGIDLGIESFATLSTGEQIANPRHLRRGEVELTRRQRALNRRKRGSRRRKKAKLLVAKAHRKVRNQRKDFHHKTARTLVQAHSLIAIEALRPANMSRRPKAIPATTEDGHMVYLPNGAANKAGKNESIRDAGWSQFISFLCYKAEGAGCTVVKVNPSGTSQVCSGCGVLVPKALDVRWHQCDHCGCSLHRAVNAARNILARSVVGLQVSA